MTYVFGIIIVLLFLVIDHSIKQIILNSMAVGESFPLIKGLINITSVRNTGAAWNMFDGQLIFFIIITIIALAIFLYFFTKADFYNEKLYSYSLTMIIAGTIGNFIDRMFYPNHEVVDMFEFAFMKFPVFNFADMLLVIGIIIFAIKIIFFTKEEKNG